MLTFVGVGKIQPGKMDEVLQALDAFVPKIRTEESTIEYIDYRGTQDPNVLVFLEKYRDEQAQKAHGASAEMQTFLSVIGPAIDGEPIMTVVEEAAAVRH